MLTLDAQAVSQSIAPVWKFAFLMLGVPSCFKNAFSDFSVWFVGLPSSPSRNWPVLGVEGSVNFSVTYFPSPQESQAGQVTTLNGHRVLPD